MLRFPRRDEARLRLVTPDPREPWRAGVPLVDLAAAAGGFSPEQLLEEAHETEEWYSWEGAPSFQRGDFLARVVGNSMTPLIPPGALCLFRLSNLETTSRRPVLARLATDGEGACYTVKDLHIEWAEDQQGGRAWKRIELRPQNPAHPTLRFDPKDRQQISVIAEVVAVLGES